MPQFLAFLGGCKGTWTWAKWYNSAWCRAGRRRAGWFVYPFMSANFWVQVACTLILYFWRAAFGLNLALHATTGLTPSLTVCVFSFLASWLGSSALRSYGTRPSTRADRCDRPDSFDLVWLPPRWAETETERMGRVNQGMFGLVRTCPSRRFCPACCTTVDPVLIWCSRRLRGVRSGLVESTLGAVRGAVEFMWSERSCGLCGAPSACPGVDLPPLYCNSIWYVLYRVVFNSINWGGVAKDGAICIKYPRSANSPLLRLPVKS